MTVSNATLQVGDVVIFTETYGSRPKLDNVSKVTKSGQIEIAGKAGTKFKLAYNGAYKMVGHRLSYGKSQLVYLLTNGQPADRSNITDPKLDELRKAAEKIEAAEAEKQASKERQAAVRDARIAAELAEVKTACGGTLPVKSSETLPDGGRLVVMNLPVKPENAERKGGFEILICRLKNERSWSTEGEQVVLCTTYLNGSNSSFPNRSGSYFDNDEEALWDAVRYQYNSW